MEKLYLISSIGTWESPIGILTNDLSEDFIKRFHISWREDFGDDDILGLNPSISEVKCDTDIEVSIFLLDIENKKSTTVLYLNTYLHDMSDLEDFIIDNYKELSYDPIVKFKDFK